LGVAKVLGTVCCEVGTVFFLFVRGVRVVGEVIRDILETLNDAMDID